MFEELRKNPLMIIILCALLIIIIIAVFTPRKHRLTAGFNLGGHIGSLKGEFNIETFTGNSEPCLVLFYAPWCGHCKNMMPVWDNLINSNTSKVKIIKVNCDENKDIASKHGIKGFPTIKYLPQGVNNVAGAIEHTGERTLNSFQKFLKSL
jgi:protein disulfide-isomerase-like protein